MNRHYYFIAMFIISSPINSSELTTFFKWCRMGNFEKIKQYVDDNYDVAVQDEEGNTPFHLVSQSGKQAGDIINYMIRFGKTASTENVLGITNVHNVSVADAIYDCIPDYAEPINRNQA